jgi:hypothetical protein
MPDSSGQNCFSMPTLAEMVALGRNERLTLAAKWGDYSFKHDAGVLAESKKAALLIATAEHV